jgi:hypothetical protein
MAIFFGGFDAGIVFTLLVVARFVLYPPEGKEIKNAGSRQRQLG